MTLKKTYFTTFYIPLALIISSFYVCCHLVKPPVSLLSTSISALSISTQTASANVNSFSTLDELLSANLSEGSTGYTSGFYSMNDGGGGKYLIAGKNTPVDNKFTFKTSNGLVAKLTPQNNNVNVAQLGAKGDGVSDDAPYLQAAFNSGCNVTLGKSKSYKLISNGLAINNNLTVYGNNSTLIVDDSYKPQLSGFSKFVIRSGTSSLENLTIHNLAIDCRIKQSRYSGSNYLCIFQPLNIKTISLNNLDIYVTESYNKIVNFWMYTGCDRLTLNDCDFENNTISNEGGIIFLNSGNDTRYGYFNSFKDVTLNRCSLKGQCSDEGIALWGPNNINFKMVSSSLEWTHARKDHTSRAINIACSDNTKASYNATFYDCTINVDSPNADSAIGVGSNLPCDINVRFVGCNFNANVKDSLLHFQLLQNSPWNLKYFNYDTDKYKISFDNCNITCSKTITGSNSFYNNNESTLNWPIDCSFTKCEINCNYAFAVLSRFSKTAYYYVPKISLDGCTVTINNAIGFIYKSNYSAIADIQIKDTTVNSPNVTSLTTYRYTDSNGTGTTQNSVTVAKASTAISNSKVNSNVVDR